MDAKIIINSVVLSGIAIVATLFQMGCTPPPPALAVAQQDPNLVVKAGQPLTLTYTINSPLAQQKALFNFADEFILRTFKYVSSDIEQNFSNSSGLIGGGAEVYMTNCDFFDISCWALEYVGTVSVTPIANTTYTFTVTDTNGEFPLASCGSNLLECLLTALITVPHQTQTYEDSIDVVVDPDILISAIPPANLNVLDYLAGPPLTSGTELRDCIEALPADTTSGFVERTSQVTGDVECADVTDLAGIQFFYNMHSITIGSAVELNLNYLKYLKDVSTIDVSGTANTCADQQALQAAMAPGVVVIDSGC